MGDRLRRAIQAQQQLCDPVMILRGRADEAHPAGPGRHLRLGVPRFAQQADQLDVCVGILRLDLEDGLQLLDRFAGAALLGHPLGQLQTGAGVAGFRLDQTSQPLFALVLHTTSGRPPPRATRRSMVAEEGKGVQACAR